MKTIKLDKLEVHNLVVKKWNKLKPVLFDRLKRGFKINKECTYFYKKDLDIQKLIYEAFEDDFNVRVLIDKFNISIKLWRECGRLVFKQTIYISEFVNGNWQTIDSEAQNLRLQYKTAEQQAHDEIELKEVTIRMYEIQRLHAKLTCKVEEFML